MPCQLLLLAPQGNPPNCNPCAKVFLLPPAVVQRRESARASVVSTSGASADSARPVRPLYAPGTEEELNSPVNEQDQNVRVARNVFVHRSLQG